MKENQERQGTPPPPHIPIGIPGNKPSKPEIAGVKCSVVIPVMNEEGNVTVIAQKVIDVLKDISLEILFVDDGSTDNTLSILKNMHNGNPQIKYLSFSRNFGHQAALKAGLDYAKGDCIISLDGDMQHPPELIPAMIELWASGEYDIVYTIRKDDKKLSFFKRITSRLFYRVLNYFTDIVIEPGSADFRLLDRKVVDCIRRFHESPLFFRGIIPWVGFKQYAIEYTPHQRFSGTSKYSVRKMLQFALNGIMSFSVKPLMFSVWLGVFFSFAAFCYGIYAIIQKIFFDQIITGWMSTLTLVSFIGGIQLMMIGIIGIYLGKLFMDSKERPAYIIQEKSDA